MQKTNLVPAIEKRTVSGSSVSFNTAFALPLKKCEVSFMATQSGSGTPSPVNKRPIVPVSSVAVTFNGTSISKALGADYGGGYVDLLTGKAYITHGYYNLGNIGSWTYYTSGANPIFYAGIASDGKIYNSNEDIDCICSEYYAYPKATTRSAFAGNLEDKQFGFIYNTTNIVIRDDDYTDAVSFKTAMSGVYIRYELETPIELTLTPEQLSSVVGNNTFSTDTGTLEITFADLQEKSASGAVASFNTALAMPLVECKTEFMCTQASGTPSPSNPLAITGVDKVAIQYGGKNLFNIANSINNFYLSDLGTIEPFTAWNLSDYQIVKPNTTYHFKPNSTSGGSAKHGYYDENKNFIGYISSGEQTFTTPNNAYYMRFSYRNTSSDIMLNFGSTAENYEPYISNTVTLIDLDGTRYGGYVDVVRKKLVVTRKSELIKNVGFTRIEYSGIYAFTKVISDKANGISNVICEVYKPSNASTVSLMPDLSIKGNSTTKAVYIRDDSFTDYSTFENAVGDYSIVYELETPIEISLSDIPTLSTIIGNNSFASDSGNIELTYKDLDIAKRGNFREVFKLPS